MEQIADKQGVYYVIDTEVEASETWVVKGLNGTQGDDLRTVNFAIKEGTISGGGQDVPKPKNLAGLAVRFAGKDANGKRKYVDGMFDVISESGGLVSVTLPKEVYMAHGDYESAFLEIYDPKGRTNTATVKLAMTVIQNDVAFTTNPSADYISRVEDIIKACENKFDVATKNMNKRIDEFATILAAQSKQFDANKALLETQIKLIESKSVPIPSSDVKWTGIHEYLKTIQGFTLGTEVAYFGPNQPQQDLNDIQVLRDMKPATSQTTYYGGNKLLNNPNPGDYVIVKRHKVTISSVYEEILRFNEDSGTMKVRLVQGVNSAPKFGDWGIVSEWGQKWKPLAPYLTDDFIAHSATPEYRIVGDEVEFRGAITPKKTLANSSNESFAITKPLPFTMIGGQDTINVSSGSAIYALFGYGNKLEMQKHQIGGKWADVPAGGYVSIGGKFSIKI